MKSIALSTKAVFSYTPTSDEIIKELKRLGKTYNEKTFLNAPDAEKSQATTNLVEREKKLRL